MKENEKKKERNFPPFFSRLFFPPSVGSFFVFRKIEISFFFFGPLFP